MQSIVYEGRERPSNFNCADNDISGATTVDGEIDVDAQICGTLDVS
jgi:hypothetical protein